MAQLLFLTLYDMAEEPVKDQAPQEQSPNDQGNAAPGEGEQPAAPAADSQQGAKEDVATVEIDGEKVPLEELKKGYMRTKDYTKKTQELAEEKRKLARTPKAEEKPKDDKPAAPTGEADESPSKKPVTWEDLHVLELQAEDERQLRELLDTNPDLKSREKAIRAIGKIDNTRSWEDIITDPEYGFSSKDKLVRAKSSRDVVGEPAPKTPPAEKDISDMTTEEFEEWKKRNLKRSSRYSLISS